MVGAKVSLNKESSRHIRESSLVDRYASDLIVIKRAGTTGRWSKGVYPLHITLRRHFGDKSIAFHLRPPKYTAASQRSDDVSIAVGIDCYSQTHVIVSTPHLTHPFQILGQSADGKQKQYQ